MARIAGITLPPEKRIEIGLTYIYGIGRSKASQILDEARIDKSKKVKDLTEDEVNKIRQIIEKREKNRRRAAERSFNQYQAVN